MPFHVRDEETDTLVRELARKEGVGLTEAIKIAVTNELRRKEDDVARRMAAIRILQEKVAGFPDTGLAADKAFYDSLSGEDD